MRTSLVQQWLPAPLLVTVSYFRTSHNIFVKSVWRFRNPSDTFVAMLKDGEYPPTTHPDAFPSRLREALESYGRTSRAAKAIGRSEGAVRKWLAGKSQPNVSDLRAICDLTGFNVEWLVTGRGPREGTTEAGDSSGRQSSAALAPLNYKLLEDSAVAVKLEARIAGKPLTPEKCAAILATVYNACVVTRQVEQETADRIVALAT